MGQGRVRALGDGEVRGETRRTWDLPRGRREEHLAIMPPAPGSASVMFAIVR
jgi:hypothetical protein